MMQKIEEQTNKLNQWRWRNFWKISMSTPRKQIPKSGYFHYSSSFHVPKTKNRARGSFFSSHPPSMLFFTWNLYFERIGAAWRKTCEIMKEENLIVMWPYESYFRQHGEDSAEQMKRNKIHWSLKPYLIIFRHFPWKCDLSCFVVDESFTRLCKLYMTLRKNETSSLCIRETITSVLSNNVRPTGRDPNGIIKYTTLFSSPVLDFTDDDLPIRPIPKSVKNRSGWNRKNEAIKEWIIPS